ncbi:hypothetical protein NDN08_004366 [Rhodosorus marinus]|uniref:RRM domain-containing protein n=1 Tax=Rhodosorus marinus TaxID=101924 RepID=A0AAV8UPM4_9RHOD|nr:hypothetical protein NDN08_004366 [Rhodosorus marinus]
MGDSMNIDQSLDDIIQSSRTVIRTEGGRGGSGGGGGGGGGDGDGRKPVYSSRVHRTIYKPAGRRAGGWTDTDRGRWQHDKYRPVLKQPYGRTGTYSKPMSQSSGAKIVVGNLDLGVSNSDINDLFKGIGPIKQAMVIYNSDGKSTGSAEVVFTTTDDALAAIAKYNGVPLDNRPLEISLSTNHGNEGTFKSRGSTRPATKPATGGYVDLDDPDQQPEASVAPSGRPVIRTGRGFSRGFRRSRGGFRGRGRERGPRPSKEDLDRDLDSIVEGSGQKANGAGEGVNEMDQN